MKMATCWYLRMWMNPWTGRLEAIQEMRFKATPDRGGFCVHVHESELTFSHPMLPVRALEAREGEL